MKLDKKRKGHEERKAELKKVKIRIIEKDKELSDSIHNLEQIKQEVMQEEIKLETLDKNFIEESKNSEKPIVERGKVKKYSAMKGFKNKIKDKLSPQKSFLITMRFSNGTEKSWIITTDKEVFYFKGRGYYLRYQDNFFDLSSSRYKLYFHEDFCCPFDRNILVLKDTKGIHPKAFFSVTPHNLKPLIKMEYVKALAQAGEISKYFKLIIILIVTILLLVLFCAYQLYRAGGLG